VRNFHNQPEEDRTVSNPNSQSLIAFGVITVLVLIGLAAKVMLGRSKRDERRSDLLDF
jgi:hypothetical protein